MVAFVLSQAEKSEIQLAEMTLAKYLYLLQTIYKIQLNLKFKRWHLGPYAPEIKKIINNRTYFKLDKNAIKILNKDKLTKYNFNDKEEVERSMNSLAKIFSYYSVKDRSRKTELLATLCRVIEEIKSMDFESVRKSMQDWPIELDSSNFKNKAQKFSEDETKNVWPLFKNRAGIKSCLLNKRECLCQHQPSLVKFGVIAIHFGMWESVMEII